MCRNGNKETASQSPEVRSVSGCFALGLIGLSCVYLWGVLISQLRLEWTLNPQYTYGWGVPFLCAYLAWRETTEPRPIGHPLPLRALPASRWMLFIFLTSCALLFAPTRIIQEANPDWRLVSWALAVEAIGITLSALGLGFFAVTAGRLEGGRSRPWSPSQLIFPLCFMLVAVPWPTLIEWPIVQGLTRANLGIVTEVLSWFGIPVLAQGNTLQTSAGVIGMDEACSGIRSVQATLMMSLFLGQFYRLPAARRLALCLGGFSLAFIFNCARTLTLVAVASRQGMATESRWHDPAGATILVGCFVSLWFMGLWAARGFHGGQPASSPIGDCNAYGGGSGDLLGSSPGPLLEGIAGKPSMALLFAAALTLWLAAVEVGVQAWYRIHEADKMPVAGWTIRVPQDLPSFREVAFSQAAQRMLRYNRAENFSWQEGERRWQVIFTEWEPARTTIYLANMHQPSNCLTGMGKTRQADLGTARYDLNGIRLAFHRYEFTEPDGTPLFVFACVWARLRGILPSSSDEPMTVANRLRAALAGRRNPGQQNLEIALWGTSDVEEAESAILTEVRRLVVPGST